MDDSVKLFPRGLTQPEKGFRFGADALLLACFLPQGPARLLDLGTGCGPVALGWLLRNPAGSAIGLELNPESAACARDNAARLGLETRLDVHDGDVRAVRDRHAERKGSARLEPESFDLVACNPPYHAPGTGRTPHDAGRLAAIFHGNGNADEQAISTASTPEHPASSEATTPPAQPDNELRGSRGAFAPGGERSGEGQRPSPALAHAEQAAGLADFVAASAYALKLRGRACFVFPAERLTTLLAELAACRLEPKRLRFVHPRMGEPARRVLVEARKGGGEGLIVEPPLLLYNGAHMTTDALAFCPFLSCNPVVNSEGEQS